MSEVKKYNIEDYYTNSTSASVITMLEKPEAINAVVTLMFTVFGVSFASEKLDIKLCHLHEELGLYKPLETVEDIKKIKVWYDGHQIAIQKLLKDTGLLMSNISYNIYNPVIGCPMGCPYCYSHSINEQFHLVDDWKDPVYRGPYKMSKDENGNDVPELFMKRPKNGKPIAWMLTYYSDLGCWKPQWQKEVMEQIIASIKLRKLRGETPDTFTMVTKNPHGIDMSFIEEGTYIPEVTFGCTVDKNQNTARISNLIKQLKHFRPTIMVTYQPLLEHIDPVYLDELAATFGPENCFVLIGPEISNKGNAAPTPFEWMKDIIDACEELGIHYAFHNSLRATVEGAGYEFHPQINSNQLYENRLKLNSKKKQQTRLTSSLSYEDELNANCR